MKKILKHGNLDIRGFKCPKCDCEFLADSEEYKRTSDTNILVSCPECYHEFLIFDKQAIWACSMPVNCKLCTCLSKCIEHIDNNEAPVRCSVFDKLKNWRKDNNESKTTN